MRGFLSGKLAFLATFILMTLVVLTACKKSPTDSVDPVESIAAGSYVGYGDMGDGPVNVWLAVLAEELETDTSGVPSLSGFIEYGNEREQLLSVTTDSAQSSLALEYSYNGVIHRATSGISTQGLELEFSIPSGLSTLRMNREIGGSNMTGKWLGTMSSNYLQMTSDATMIMDQWGVDFIGDVDVEFSASLHGDINSGSVAGSDFSLEGTGYYGSYATGVRLWGQYLHQDTVGGNWELGTGAQVYDSGSFLFWRDF